MSDPTKAWLRTLSHSLRDLPVKTQTDILAEVRAHLADRREQGFSAEQALKGFGDAAGFARRFRADVTFDEALAQTHWRDLLAGLFSAIGRSVTAAFALVSAGLCALLAVRIAGLFGEKLGLLGAEPLPFVLPDIGFWIYPACILLLFTLWLAARLSLKLAVTSLRMDPAQ